MNLPVQDPMNPSGFGRLPWGLISSPSVRMAHGAARPAWAMAAHVWYSAIHEPYITRRRRRPARDAGPRRRDSGWIVRQRE